MVDVREFTPDEAPVVFRNVWGASAVRIVPLASGVMEVITEGSNGGSRLISVRDGVPEHLGIVAVVQTDVSFKAYK